MNVQVLSIHPCSDKKILQYAKGSVYGTTKARLLIFGITGEGQSICLHVKNVPYFFYVNLQGRTTEEFQTALNKISYFPVHTLSFERRKFIFGYIPDSNGDPQQFSFAKITCYQLDDARKAKNIVQSIDAEHNDTFSEDSGSYCKRLKKDEDGVRFQTYAHHPNLQVYLQLNISPLDWIHVPSNAAKRSRVQLSTCDIESECEFDDLKAQPSITEIGPLKICSWDIETYSKSRSFPRSENTSDKVISIGLSYAVYGKPGEYRREVLCLGESEKDEDIEICCYKTESELLSGFQQKIRNVDVLFGFNNFFFDTPYLSDRARRINFFTRPGLYRDEVEYLWKASRRRTKKYKSLYNMTQEMKDPRDPFEWKPILKEFQKIYPHVRFFRDTFLPPQSEIDIVLGVYETKEDLIEAFSYFGQQPPTSFFSMSRIAKEVCHVEVQPLQSAAMGANILHKCDMTGRISFDLFLYIKNNFKLGSYKLNSIANEFLGETKVDLPYQQLFDLFDEGKPSGLKKINVYCSMDCDLPLRLLEKLNIIPPIVEQSRICKVEMNQLFTRGQQIKVWNCLSYMAERKQYVMNKVHVDRPKEYVGATVLEPTPGYHEHPIVTLDFASLYPSIMMAHNLCFSTWVKPQDRDKLLEMQEQNKVELLDMEAGGERHLFVKGKNGSVRRGILPLLEHTLLEARRRTKKMMKQEKDPFKKALLDGRQLALKIVCNSAYGFCGVTTGFMPLWPIAACTTTLGRHMIYDSKKSVEEKYPGSEIVYGDTDSVMIKFANVSKSAAGVQEAWKLGEEAAAYLTDVIFGEHEEVVMEMEKVYWPYILWNVKKRYAGRCYMHPTKKPKWDCKGTEIVRRDNCEILKDIYTACLNIIMPLEGDVKSKETIHDHLKETIADFFDRAVSGKIDLEKYVISKSLSKAIYKSCNLPHVYLAEKIKARIRELNLMEIPPQTGDRIPYIITQGIGKLYTRAEDPEFFKKNQHTMKLKLDVGYYIDKQIRTSIEQLTRYFLPEFKRMCNIAVQTASTMGNVRLKSKRTFKERLLTVKVDSTNVAKRKLYHNPSINQFGFTRKTVSNQLKENTKSVPGEAEKHSKKRSRQSKIQSFFTV